MKRHTTYPSIITPLFLWVNLAVKTSEMLIASAQVISHRTGRIASSGAIPSLRDQREFTLMGQEKIDAFTESSQAIVTRIITINQQAGIIAFKQMLNGVNGLMALSASSSLDQSSRQQRELMRNAIENSAAMASHLSGSMAHLADHGLRPIYSRATRNAKRLLKN